jgi:hypothetical protein
MTPNVGAVWPLCNDVSRPGLVPGIHDLLANRIKKTWMAGTKGRLRPSSRAMPGHDGSETYVRFSGRIERTVHLP